MRNGLLRVHKSKRNSNGTFSIGKTWALEELSAIEVAEPQAFTITLNGKEYRWQIESPREQVDFLVSLVRSFRLYTRKDVRVLGFQVNEVPGGACCHDPLSMHQELADC